MNFQSENRKDGFTLVEIIIAIGLFITVVTISLGSLIGLYNANNKSQSLSSVINNINYSVENMVRIIRFANIYHCGNIGTLTAQRSCDSGDTFLAITTGGQTTIYRINGAKLEVSTNGGASYTPVTSGEVTVTNAKFYVFNTTPGDNNQPYVLMTIKGYAGKKPSTQSSFDIQTTVSRRKLDL
jgi:type II secretory pathway pseudopilin PulG